MIELDAYYMGVIDQMSSAYRMTTAGFRQDSSIEGYLLQGALTYLGNAFAQAWWTQYRELMVGDDPGFVALFDEAVAAVGSSRNLDQYRAIATELASPGTD